MMQMKKILITASLIISALALQAQAIGIQAGMNFATGEFEDISDIQGLSGIRIGPIVQFPIGPIVEIHTGALYSQQGFELSNLRTQIDYIDVPLAIALSFDLGNMGAFVKAGPVFGVGIGGKYLDSAESKITFGSGDGEVSVLEIGGEFGAGIKLGTLQISATYDQGFTELISNRTDPWKNQIFHVALSFVIGN